LLLDRQHSLLSGDGGWQVRDADVEKKGCQDAGPALAGVGPNARPGCGAQCKI